MRGAFQDALGPCYNRFPDSLKKEFQAKHYQVTILRLQEEVRKNNAFQITLFQYYQDDMLTRLGNIEQAQRKLLEERFYTGVNIRLDVLLAEDGEKLRAAIAAQEQWQQDLGKMLEDMAADLQNVLSTTQRIEEKVDIIIEKVVPPSPTYIPPAAKTGRFARPI